AFRTGGFDRILQEDTAILDIGGGSIQVSLFEGGKLITTQNMKLGVLRLRERLGRLNASSHKQKDLVEEIVAAQMDVFRNLYLQGRSIKNIILVDDYLSPVIRGRQQEEDLGPGYLRKKTLKEFLKKLDQMSVLEIVEALDISQENAQLLLITAVLANSVMSALKAEVLWAPGVTLCDGIAYEYAEKNHFISAPHDFEADIISSAENISNRYMGSLTRSATLQTIALNIYDAMKKIHGLGKRERLLLQLATLLHDCGKYISLVNLGDCSYNIIMSTEIIGLSHREREIVANVVKFNHMPFESYDVIVVNSGMSEDDYLIIAKLTAILRVANALDRSHKQKFKDVKMSLKDGKLEISVDTRDDITVEKGLFKNRADFFEEVFFVKPVIRQKKYN
ncbi:MAG: exopolyphosphatase, partial [Lachnospiraceae bacterium]|nr:exopolyphosphatase [Lachnospiraceae bacterium]